MKKVVKYKDELTGKKITLTVNDKLQKYKGRDFASKKLEESNRMLRNLKTPLPK